MRRFIFTICGGIVFSLGVAGIVLPVLPSTPLFLLALFCFGKGSAKIEKRFVGTKIYKKYLADYVHTKAMPLKQKIAVQIFATSVMVIIFILGGTWYTRFFLLIGALAHNYIFIFKIKTKVKNEPSVDIAKRCSDDCV